MSALTGKIEFTFPNRLCGLNEYVDSCRSHWSRGASKKALEEEVLSWYIKAAKPDYLQGPVQITFDWYEPDMRRDPDNICFAKKFILDALVSQHVIRGDGWKILSMPTPFQDNFYVDKQNPRVVVTITQVDG